MQIVKSQNTSTNNIAISIEIVEYLEENGRKEKKIKYWNERLYNQNVTWFHLMYSYWAIRPSI